MQTITVTNFKGGSGKTTSAAFLAHAFQQLGRNVLAVDADPQGSLLRWNEYAEWTVPVIGLPARNLHRQLPGIAGQRFDVAVIDTPPLDDQSGIVYSAIRAASAVILPMAPTMMELERVPEVVRAVEEVEDQTGRDVPLFVLLNRTIPNASSTDVVRGRLAELKVQVLHASIPRREAIAQAFGAPIAGKLHGYLSAAEQVGATEGKAAWNV